MIASLYDKLTREDLLFIADYLAKDIPRALETERYSGADRVAAAFKAYGRRLRMRLNRPATVNPDVLELIKEAGVELDREYELIACATLEVPVGGGETVTIAPLVYLGITKGSDSENLSNLDVDDIYTRCVVGEHVREYVRDVTKNDPYGILDLIPGGQYSLVNAKRVSEAFARPYLTTYAVGQMLTKLEPVEVRALY